MIARIAIACLFLFSTDVLAQRAAVSAKEVTGTFRHHVKWSFYDEVKILALGDNRLYVDFAFVRPKAEDDANFGWTGGIAHIEGDSAVFREVTEYGDAPCVIILRFTKPGELVVIDDNGMHNCGFGWGVSGGGTYKKISGKRPEFDSPESIPERASVSAKEVTGTFRLRMKDRDNTVKIEAIRNNKLYIELQCSVPSVGISPTGIIGIATINGDLAEFRSSSANYTDCFLRLKFTKEGEVLISDNVSDMCYLGRGLQIYGYYKRMSSNPPDFTLPIPKVE